MSSQAYGVLQTWMPCLFWAANIDAMPVSLHRLGCFCAAVISVGWLWLQRQQQVAADEGCTGSTCPCHVSWSLSLKAQIKCSRAPAAGTLGRTR